MSIIFDKITWEKIKKNLPSGYTIPDPDIKQYINDKPYKTSKRKKGKKLG